MPLRRILGLSAAVSGHLRRGLSTSTSRPPWAMIYQTKLVDSPARLVSLELAETPCPSHLLVPAHLVDLEPPSHQDLRNGAVCGTVGRTVVSTSGDGLLIVQFTDLRDEPRVDPRHLSAPMRGFRN
ncbi:hypothetical protein QOZ80_5BG0417590 [Eleusine coracana subsp. coracana]|nr:hypothetical protein QOZ80_5BG0417590 [Eleusine coracana subsp. coracana]